MYQGDPTIQTAFSTLPKEELLKLGIEAQSILKSVQTEHQKLQQARLIARSDLHYFRARFNYYRLSLMRLETTERKLLEPTLSEFRASIVKREAGVDEPAKDVSYTPFLTPVESQPQAPAVELKTEPSVQLSLNAQPTVTVEAPTASPTVEEPKPSPTVEPELESSKSFSSIKSELSLLKIALQAEPSKDGNNLISESIDRILKNLN